jgi:predicted P-loop ATPase
MTEDYGTTDRAGNGRGSKEVSWQRKGERRRREPPPPKNAARLVDHIVALPQWRGLVRRNRFSEQLEILEPVPWRQPREDFAEGWRTMNDIDLTRAMINLQGTAFSWATAALVFEAFVEIGERNLFDPLKTWAESVPWDGGHRADRLFIDYIPGIVPPACGPERDARIAYYEHIGRNFFIGGMARLLHPGEKVDSFPVIIGPQGYGKSQGARALCPFEEAFTDDLPDDLGSADARRSLIGKFIIELSELSQLTGDARRLKRFFSKRSDRSREVYGRLTRDVPRRCTFISTVNELCLSDITGNRRYEPVEVDRPVNVARLKADRDLLWAEGRGLLLGGAQWWLPPNIARIAAEEAADFLDDDPWYAALADWAPRQKGGFPLVKALREALGLAEAGAQSKSAQGRAANCLRLAGFRRERDRSGNGRLHRRQPMLWVPDPAAADSRARE